MRASGLVLVGISVAGSQPAYVARRSRCSHKLLKVLVEALAAFQREIEMVIDDGNLDSQPLERY
jgi:hypothetical protein